VARERPSAAGAGGTLPAVGPSFARLLFVLAALVIVVIGIRLASGFLTPLILGGFVVVLCLPILGIFERRGWPRWTGVLAAAGLYVAAVAVLVIVALVSLRELAGMVPGFDQGASEIQSEIEDALSPIVGDAAGAIAQAIALAPLIPAIKGIASTLLGAGAVLAVAGLIVVYGLIGAKNMPGIALSGLGEHPGAAAGWERFASGMRSFFVARAVLGAVMATGAAIWLAILGQDLVLFWAIVAFFFSFVPSVGLILSMVGPALIALVTQGWQTALLVVLGYSAINVVVDYMIQPRMMARELNLSPLVVFVSLLLWAALLGPIGALLAIPMTLGVQILLGGFDDSRWVALLLSNTAPEPGAGAMGEVVAEGGFEPPTKGL
jgi:AI-2 transport protein TqsA